MRVHPFLDDSAAVDEHEDEEDLDDSEEEEMDDEVEGEQEKIASRLSNEGTLQFCRCMHQF